MRAKRILAGAALVVSMSACTPQEVAFWRAFHAEHPAEAEATLRQFGLLPEEGETADTPPTTATPDPPETSIPMIDISDGAHSAVLNCPDMTVTVTNRLIRPRGLAINYGPLQTPIGPLSTDVPPGGSVTVDVSEAAGQQLMVFLGNGGVLQVASLTC